MNWTARVAVAAALFVGVSITETAWAQDSYPLKIRGGGTLSVANDGNGGVRITFVAAPGPYGNGLEPGQGSWADRALADDEPRVVYDTAKHASQYIGKLVLKHEHVTLKVYNDGKGLFRVQHDEP
jgi:hypothetical protein